MILLIRRRRPTTVSFWRVILEPDSSARGINFPEILLIVVWERTPDFQDRIKRNTPRLLPAGRIVDSQVNQVVLCALALRLFRSDAQGGCERYIWFNSSLLGTDVAPHHSQRCVGADMAAHLFSTGSSDSIHIRVLTTASECGNSVLKLNIHTLDSKGGKLWILPHELRGKLSVKTTLIQCIGVPPEVRAVEVVARAVADTTMVGVKLHDTFVFEPR